MMSFSNNVNFEGTVPVVFMVKPDAYRDALEIKRVFERRFKFEAVQSGFIMFDEDLFMRFFEPLIGKPYFGDLSDYITSGLCLVNIYRIPRRSSLLNDILDYVGTKDPVTAREGSLRYLYGLSTMKNAVHCSNTFDDGIREAEVVGEYLQ